MDEKNEGEKKTQKINERNVYLVWNKQEARKK